MRKRFQRAARFLAVVCILFTGGSYLRAAPLSPIWALEFSPDGETLAVGKYQWVELWDLQTQRLIHTYEPHAGAVRCLTFSADGTTLYAGSGLASETGEITVWDVDAENRIGHLEVHGDTLESISLHPGNGSLITASMDESSAVIDVTQLRNADSSVEDAVSKWLTQHLGRVLSTVYHPDGNYFVTGSEDATLKVWNPDTYTVFVNFDANDDAVHSLAYSTAEDVIISGSADQTIRTWRVTPTDTGGEMTGALVREYNGHQGTVYSVDATFVRVGAGNNPLALIASGSEDGTVILWRLRAGNRYATFEEPTDAIYAVQFSPNGEFVAAAGRDGKVRLWNVRRRTLTHEF